MSMSAAPVLPNVCACSACGRGSETWHQCGPKDWAAAQLAALLKIQKALDELLVIANGFDLERRGF